MAMRTCYETKIVDVKESYGLMANPARHKTEGSWGVLSRVYMIGVWNERHKSPKKMHDRWV